MPNTKKLKLNAPLRGYSPGTILTIRTDKNGIPLDPYWRRRLKDAEIDKCVEIVSKPRTTKANPVQAETKKRGD